MWDGAHREPGVCGSGQPGREGRAGPAQGKASGSVPNISCRGCSPDLTSYQKTPLRSSRAILVACGHLQRRSVFQSPQDVNLYGPEGHGSWHPDSGARRPEEAGFQRRPGSWRFIRSCLLHPPPHSISGGLSLSLCLSLSFLQRRLWKVTGCVLWGLSFLADSPTGISR